MEFLYCFENASLTQRVLVYLLKKLRSDIDCVTVIFLNDRWVVYLTLDEFIDTERCDNCWAFLHENGAPYTASPTMIRALKDLKAGCSINASNC